MPRTEFYITGGSSKSDVNGGGPRLGTNDGPVYTTADATVAGGTPTIITDNTGSPWSGAQADDWVCWDSAGVKEFRRIVSISGTDATMSSSMTAGANKNVNVGGAWSTDLALTFVTTSFVNAAADAPRLNIKSNASITLSAARTTATATITVPITIEGYNSAVGDLLAETWAQSHNSYGFLTTTGYPTITCGVNLLTTGFFTFMRCLILTSTRGGLSVSQTDASQFFRLKITNSANNVSAQAVAQGLRSTFDDCEFLTTGTTSARSCALSSGLMTACRVTSMAGDAITTAVACTISNCIIYNIAAGKTGVLISAVNIGVILLRNTFNNCGTGISMPDLAQTNGLLALRNNHFANCGTNVINLRSATQVIPLSSIANRMRDQTAAYTGWFGDSLFDMLTDDADATEYVDVANKDFHLKSGALGLGAGYPPSLDIGAWQRATDYPAVGNVWNDTTDGNTGTLILPGAASGSSTLRRERGANARGGSGTCAGLTPTSVSFPGYWDFFVPATPGTSLTVSFYHKISSGFNGTLKVSIYDVEDGDTLLNQESVTLVDDGAYHLHTCTTVTPGTVESSSSSLSSSSSTAVSSSSSSSSSQSLSSSSSSSSSNTSSSSSSSLEPTVGLCRVRLIAQNGSVSGSIFVDDISVS